MPPTILPCSVAETPLLSSSVFERFVHKRMDMIDASSTSELLQFLQATYHMHQNQNGCALVAMSQFSHVDQMNQENWELWIMCIYKRAPTKSYKEEMNSVLEFLKKLNIVVQSLLSPRKTMTKGMERDCGNKFCMFYIATCFVNFFTFEFSFQPN